MYVAFSKDNTLQHLDHFQGNPHENYIIYITQWGISVNMSCNISALEPY